ncbi:ABC-type nitrate/sulfonate/bicarbonate transport system, periplasmic component [Methylocaldum marinum]|uniref:ABC-type nitrate/sulfonate/bicarbonate transport system, periplasmic component n=1 Tax=Methylocaldum marinum TaxID=1432792 RepID=A0A250KS86_9GAMM|nr:ABC-type nitrate/sulfonate/bicarbonate transport system, periplasmic component [Methylocaldum marinum]
MQGEFALMGRKAKIKADASNQDSLKMPRPAAKWNLKVVGRPRSETKHRNPLADR